MKKIENVEIKIENHLFPGKAWGMYEDKKVVVKNALPGQVLRVDIVKKRKKYEGRLVSVVEKSPDQIEPACGVFARCGGCSYQNLAYDDQVKLKEDYVLGLFDQAGLSDFSYDGIIPSPEVFAYRNKMEYSFGDEIIDGPLVLGLHEKGSFYNIVKTDSCVIADGDFRLIQKGVLDFFSDQGATYFHKRSHQGFLRHLVVRKGKKTGAILINLVTTSQDTLGEEAFVGMLTSLALEGQIKGILHTINDGVADVVKAESSQILFGVDHITDEIFDLRFEISPFSFFQTNTLGAEKLYGLVRDYLGDQQNRVIYDLYCGTGTIAQVLAPIAKTVVGIDIVEEAIKAARTNAKKNKLDNCQFLAGDVLNELDKLKETPDAIVLDPPRDGIHPKAIAKIIAFKPQSFVYVSCKASSLVRDLPFFIEAGYTLKRLALVDLFPHTAHVECIALLQRETM